MDRLEGKDLRGHGLAWQPASPILVEASLPWSRTVASAPGPPLHSRGRTIEGQLAQDFFPDGAKDRRPVPLRHDQMAGPIGARKVGAQGLPGQFTVIA